MSTLMNDGLAAIRQRSASSATWPNRELAAATGREAEVDQQRSDAMWRAHKDRRILLDLVDELAEALGELARAESEDGNARHSVSGDLGARLTDARIALRKWSAL